MSLWEDSRWLDDMARCRDSATPHVLVTVLSVEGSGPREAGTKMVVTADSALGTIGGGALEHEAIAEARKALKELNADSMQRRSYPLGPRLRQCCGGRVEILLEVQALQRRQLWLYGAGHVGRDVASLIGRLPVDLVWLDSRGADAFPDGMVAHDSRIRRLTGDVAAHVEAAPDNAFHLIMTHDHDLDLELCQAVLNRPFGWAGLIASASKAARFRKRLQAAGVSVSALDQLACPIGLDGIEGKQPPVIALSVMAQMMQSGLHLPFRT